jgi:hypothetical protein
MANTLVNSLEDLFGTIKDDVDESLKAMKDFNFALAHKKLEETTNILLQIHPDGCGWCGHPHKTEDCPLRDGKGFFYHEIEYRIANDRDQRLLKQTLKTLDKIKERTESLSNTSIDEEIKQKLKKNAIRLELAHKELDETLQEFDLLFKEYQSKVKGGK